MGKKEERKRQKERERREKETEREKKGRERKNSKKASLVSLNRRILGLLPSSQS